MFWTHPRMEVPPLLSQGCTTQDPIQAPRALCIQVSSRARGAGYPLGKGEGKEAAEPAEKAPSQTLWQETRTWVRCLGWGLGVVSPLLSPRALQWKTFPRDLEVPLRPWENPAVALIVPREGIPPPHVAAAPASGPTEQHPCVGKPSSRNNRGKRLPEKEELMESYDWAGYGWGHTSLIS